MQARPATRVSSIEYRTQFWSVRYRRPYGVDPAPVLAHACPVFTLACLVSAHACLASAHACPASAHACPAFAHAC